MSQSVQSYFEQKEMTSPAKTYYDIAYKKNKKDRDSLLNILNYLQQDYNQNQQKESMQNKQFKFENLKRQLEYLKSNQNIHIKAKIAMAKSLRFQIQELKLSINNEKQLKFLYDKHNNQGDIQMITETYQQKLKLIDDQDLAIQLLKRDIDQLEQTIIINKDKRIKLQLKQEYVSEQLTAQLAKQDKMQKEFANLKQLIYDITKQITKHSKKNSTKVQKNDKDKSINLSHMNNSNLDRTIILEKLAKLKSYFTKKKKNQNQILDSEILKPIEIDTVTSTASQL